jgi:hypothetical protein
MAKNSTLRKTFSHLPVHAQAAVGIMPPAWAMPVLAKKADVGCLGENLLHWIMASGRVDLSLDWVRHGGPVSPDAQGATPIHWMASALAEPLAILMWEHAGFCKTFASGARMLDGMGRDVAGILCLNGARRELNAISIHCPSMLELGVHLGIGAPLAFADALIASKLHWSEGFDPDEMSGLARLMEGLDPPSRLLPSSLDIPGGFWSQSMWEAALVALASSDQLARMEAVEIAAQATAPSAMVARVSRI